MPRIWNYTGTETRFDYELGFFYSAVLIIIVVIWTADIFWRVVDTNCVKFARWLEELLIIKPQT